MSEIDPREFGRLESEVKNLTNDEVSIELTDELSPGVIKCDIPFLYILMPMKIT